MRAPIFISVLVLVVAVAVLCLAAKSVGHKFIWQKLLQTGILMSI